MIKKIFKYLPHVVLISIGLYFIFTTAPFVRYWVDDFCSASYLHTNGFWGAQVGWWNTWTGRYSATFFTDFFETLGPWVVKILPILLLVGLIVSAVPLFFSNKLFASLFIILALINAPNIIQTFYWQTGSLNYLIPFIFLNLFLGRLVYKKRKKNLITPFLLMFIAGGFSESFAVAALVFLIFVMVMVLVVNPKDKKEKVQVIIAGFAGMAISLIVMSLAPGNAARGLSVTKPDNIMFVVKSTILTTKWYLLRFFSIKTFLCSLGILTASTFFLTKKYQLSLKKGIILMLGSILTAILTTAAVIGSGFYSMSIIPPERTLFIVTYMILLCFMIFVFSLSMILRRHLSSKVMKYILWGLIFINIVCSLLVITSTVKHWSSVRTEIKDYAVNWDREVKNLPEIKNIKPVGGLDSFTDNKGWVTSCLSGYYAPMRVVIQTYDDKIIE